MASTLAPFQNNPTGWAAAQQSGYSQNPTIAPFANSPQGIQAAAQTPHYEQATYDAVNSSTQTPGGYSSQQQGLLDALPGQLGSLSTQAHDAAATSGNQIKSNILDYLDQYKQQQQGLDNQAIQNQLAKQQGTQGILGMIGRGIRSSGTLLANKNATDSSATGAIADAYNQLGRQQLSGVGNQFAQAQNALGQSEQQLQGGVAQQQRHYDENKINVVNNLVNNVQSQLAQIDAQLASASLPDRINLEAEKEKIRQDALGQLQQYDQLLSQGVAGVQPIGQDAARTQAASLAQAGTAAASPFEFNSSPGSQFQNTGPFASALPIFTFPGARKQAA